MWFHENSLKAFHRSTGGSALEQTQREKVTGQHPIKETAEENNKSLTV